MRRRCTRVVRIGSVGIGSGYPVSVQSMTKTPTHDVQASVRQIALLENAGCDIARLAVPDEKSAKALSLIKKAARIPIVADIHFNYKLALESIKSGVDGIRLNPGNIFKQEEIEQVSYACIDAGIPIRVGVNSGSLKPDHSRENAAEVMAEEALEYSGRLEALGLRDITISIKASDVKTTVDAYRLVALNSDYPLHLGVTAAGAPKSGVVKSAVCMGILLEEGIGDTIRVSLTGDPVEEVEAGFEILSSLDLRRRTKPEIISCPTCGRCRVDLIKMVEEAQRRIALMAPDKKLSGLKIAIMGCAVNGPGEAKEADLGVACGLKSAALFRKGKVERKIGETRVVDVLIDELKKITGEE